MNEKKVEAFETICPEIEPKGRFRLLREHAQGGLGKISVALDQELNREIAHKCIKDEYSTSEFHQEKFTQEALVTGALEHPGVVPVYGYGIDERGRLFYLMRFIRGEELASRITAFHQGVNKGKKTSFEPEFRFLIRKLIDVCHTMSYAHARGVIHRDLKPANIMLGPYGETLVLDWGLAKPLGEMDEKLSASFSAQSNPGIEWLMPIAASKSGGTETQDGQIIGTPLYAPPEQLLGHVSKIDHRSDIYSLGVILFEILIGSPPMGDKSLSDFVSSVLNGQVPSPRELSSSIPRSIDAICRKAMSADRMQRYQSVYELRLDLERWLDGLPVSVYTESFGERTLRWMRDHSTFVRACSLSLLVVACVSIFAAYGMNQAKKEQEQAKHEATQLLRIARETTEKLLRDTSDRLDDLPGTTELRGSLLKEAAVSFARIADSVKSNDIELLRESASAFVGLAFVQRLLDQRASAIESLQRAIVIYRRILEQRVAIDDDLISTADAQIQLSRVLSDDPTDPNAKKAVDQAFESIQAFSISATSAARQKLVKGQALVQKAVVASDLGDFLSAIESNTYASEVFREGLRIVDVDSTQANWQAPLRLELARSNINEAQCRFKSDEKDAAIGVLNRAAIQQLEWVIKRTPGDREAIKNYALAINNQAQLDLDSNNFDAAAKGYEIARAYAQQLQTEQPSELEYRNLSTLAFIGLGNTERLRGEIPKAMNHFKSAYENADDLVSANQVSIRFRESFDMASELYFQSLNEILDSENRDGLTNRLEAFLLATQAFRDHRMLYNTACGISKSCAILSPDPGNADADISNYLSQGWTRLEKAILIDSKLYLLSQADPDLQYLIQAKKAEFSKLQPR